MSQMRTHAATRLLALILSLRFVARMQTSLNSCDRSQRQNSVTATMIFTCHTFVAATSRGDVSQRFVTSCVSAFKKSRNNVLHTAAVLAQYERPSKLSCPTDGNNKRHFKLLWLLQIVNERILTKNNMFYSKDTK